jgi:hypothetical protein
MFKNLLLTAGLVTMMAPAADLAPWEKTAPESITDLLDRKSVV